jgi:hypothetical protein
MIAFEAQRLRELEDVNGRLKRNPGPGYQPLNLRRTEVRGELRFAAPFLFEKGE